MIDILNQVLFPIIFLMEKIFEIYVHIFISVGFSVIMLSISFSIAFIPIQKKFNKLEKKLSNKIIQINNRINTIDSNLKGEKRFNEIEKIYKDYSYHPIHNIGIGASFIILLPILVSAMLMLSQTEVTSGMPFFFIKDLSVSDNAFLNINILPIIMVAISVIDSVIKFKNDKGSLLKFLFISLFIFYLIYDFASALILYWIISNVFSLCLTIYSESS